jgi:hypothetical protein
MLQLTFPNLTVLLELMTRFSYAPVTEAAYLNHMERLYFKIKSALAPNGTLIWRTTTPVPASCVAAFITRPRQGQL